MERFARFVIRFRIPVIAVTAAITLALGYFVKDTRVNSDIMSYLPKNDPTVKLNTYIGEKYAGTQLAVVALETGNVFTRRTIGDIRGLTAAFKQIDGVQSVTSLTDVLDIKKTEEGLEVGRLIDPDSPPGTEEQLAALREYALGKDMIRGRLVSADGTATVVVSRLFEGADKARVAKEIRAAVETMKPAGKTYYAGLPFQLIEIDRLVVDDMTRLVPLAALLIVLSLYVSFRSVRGVVLPLVAVGISTIWVLGVMAAFKVAFSVITNVIPVVLMAAGSAYGIHVMSSFGEVPLGAAATGRRERQGAALSGVALPVILAAVTTMAGFLTFLFGSYLTMIKEFGIFSSLGIFFSLVVSLTFIPAVLSFLPPRRRRGRAAGGTAVDGAAPRTRSSRILGGIGRLVLKRPRIVLIAAAAMVAAGIACLPLVTREVDLLSYFKPGTDIQLAERLMRERFGGSITIQLLVKGDIKDPTVLARMKDAEAFLRTQPGLHNASSIVEIVEEMSWAMGEGRAIPDSREKVANLWFLLEGEEMIGRMVSPDAREAVISATLERLNSRELARLSKAVGGYIAAHTAPGCELALSGSAPIYKRIDDGIASSQLWSLGLAILFMFACNLFLLRSITGGLIGLLPIVFTLFVLFGVMGATGIPLDIATVLIGSISLGMGVDYSIHFLSRYRRELASGKSAEEALSATFDTTGKAIIINVVTVAVGFLALLLGSLIPLRRFGILIGVTMVSSGLGALTILPAVLLLAPLGSFRALAVKAQRVLEGIRAAARAQWVRRIKMKLERTKV